MRGAIGVITVAVVVCGAVYAQLPDSVRSFTRIAIAVTAGSVSVLLGGLTRFGAWMFSAEQRRGVPQLAAGLAAFVVGRTMEVRYRWTVDWPGLCYLLGIAMLTWSAFRRERDD
ncbi:MAG: hypothetical protein ACK5XT_08130 [Gemmatimonas sp.]|nr:hypothetical protein [Gemmatimonadota bacterium]